MKARQFKAIFFTLISVGMAAGQPITWFPDWLHLLCAISAAGLTFVGFVYGLLALHDFSKKENK